MRFILLNRDLLLTFLWYSFWPILSLSMFLSNADYSSPEAFTIYFLSNLVWVIIFAIKLPGFIAFIVGYIGCIAKVKSVQRGDYIVVQGGVPRSGKTSTCLYDYVILCFCSYYELQQEYYYLRVKKSLSEKIKSIHFSVDDEKNFKQLEKAWKFYSSNLKDRIPCGISNNAVTVQWRKHKLESNPFTAEMAVGQENIPQYSVVMVDEAEKIYATEIWRLDQTGDLANMFKYPGHMNVHWIMNTQDPDNLFIGIRRCTFKNEVHLKQKPICVPGELKWLYNTLSTLNTRFINRIRFNELDKTLRVKAKGLNYFLGNLKKFISRFGFRYMVSSYRESNVNAGANIVTEGKHRYFVPSRLNCRYDDRYMSDAMPMTQMEPIRHEWPEGTYKIEDTNNFNDKVKVALENAARTKKLQEECEEIQKKTNTKIIAKAWAENKVKQYNKQ